MRKAWAFALVVAVCGMVAVPALPASASASEYSISPAKGPAGTKITVSSARPCAAPPSGTTLLGIDLFVENAPSTELVGGGSTPANSDRTWSGTATVGSSVRNGRYQVVAVCVASDGSPYDGYEGQDFVVTSAAGQVDPAVRFAGTDRIETAIAVAEDLYPELLPDAVVLARSDSYADALAGTPFARAKDAPLLLTPTDSLDSRTGDEIEQLLGSTGTVYLLGGTSAISDAVATSLTNSGYTVTRLAGVNRYDTATRVASAIGNPTTVLLANGQDFHDGLVAGAAAGADPTGGSVVVLTNGTTLPDETKAYLAAHAAMTQYAIGSAAAGAVPSATAIAGSDFADTSRKVAEKFFPGPTAVAVANQGNFADALTGGVHAAAYGAPVLFTDPGALPATVSAYLTGNKASIVIAYVYGGTAAVSEPTRSAVVQAIT